MDKNIGKELFIIVNKMRRLLDKYHQKNGLYFGQARLLTFLYRNRNEKTYQKDIEQAFQIRGGTVTGMLDALIKIEMIERIESTTDKRKRKIVLTDKGERYAIQAIETINHYEEIFKSVVNAEDLIIFEKVLNILNETIDKEELK